MSFLASNKEVDVAFCPPNKTIDFPSGATKPQNLITTIKQVSFYSKNLPLTAEKLF